MANIKTISTADVAVDWETIYEVDLTAQGTSATANTDWPRNLTGSNGEIVSWTVGNNTKADEMKLISGTGMRIVIDGTSRDSGNWYAATQNSPVIYAPIDNIYSAAGLTYDLNETFAFQTLHEFTINTAGAANRYFYGGSMILDGITGDPATGTSAGNWMQSTWLTQGSTTETANQWLFRNGSMQQAGGSGNQYWLTGSISDADRPTFCEIVFYPGAAWSSCAGVLSKFPTPLTTQANDIYAHGSMANQLPLDMGTSDTTSGTPNTTANPGQTTQFLMRPGTTTSQGRQINVGVSAAYWTSGDARDGKVTCLWKKLRVLRRGT